MKDQMGWIIISDIGRIVPFSCALSKENCIENYETITRVDWKALEFAGCKCVEINMSAGIRAAKEGG